jgi:ATP-dependent 26S proteasome regulatory subunit
MLRPAFPEAHSELALVQMDGFDQTVNVKVIMATNRADTLDPALLRPGRLDRKIEFPLPDRRQKRLVFQVGSATWKIQWITW